MSDLAKNLKDHLLQEMGIPKHLVEAFTAWIDHVDESARATADPSDESLLAALTARVAALETTVESLHAALSGAPAPKSVRTAVADVEPLGINSSEKVEE